MTRLAVLQPNMRTLLITSVLGAALAAAQPSADEAAREKRLEWWREARFGMFIHWGIYAVPAGEWNGKPITGLGEWIMNRARIPVGEYEKLASQFNPVKFNAEEWVRIAKDAGMKYITITAKHHDGFAMFGSQASKYNIVDATPFHRDPMKELAAACQKEGLKLCFYYSQTQDWHEPDADGNTWDFPDESKKDFAKYLEEKAKPQVRELLTNYGPIGMIWFDTPRIITKEQSQELAALVHELQPACLVSGRVGHGAGDYDSAGDNQISVGKVRREWETPVTMNDTWGFRKDDHNWKPATVLIRQLAQVVSHGGNYLLNVGPTALGEIPQPSVERLAEVGRWMKVNEQSIRGTTAGPFPYDEPWGVITSKPGKLFLHVFDWPREGMVLYGLKNKVRSAQLLAGGKVLDVSQRDENGFDALRIDTPATPPDLNDSVIALEIEGEPQVDPSLLQQPDGVVTLSAYMANLHKAAGSKMNLDSRGVISDWRSAGDWADWSFKVNHPGVFNVVLVTSEQKYGRGWDGGQHVVVEVGGKTLKKTVAAGGKQENPSNPYWPYVISRIGRVRLEKAGSYALSLKTSAIPANQKYGLTLVSVRLAPAK